ncbi:MAG: hypothetical protein J6F31_10120 [Oscillospiraceae bacterium]|nr:hypothetical protein [Oscillospiraceae bacterium]
MENIFFSETKKAFAKKIGHCIFLDVIGFLGWLACTFIIVIFAKDPDVTRIYWIITIGGELLIMTPIILTQLSKYRKCMKKLSDIPQNEMDDMCSQAVYRFETYIKTEKYFYVPQCYALVPISDIRKIKPVYHYSYMLFDGIKLLIETNGGTFSANVKKYREMKNELEGLGFEY